MLEKTFDPAEAEPRIYKAWEKSGAFQPQGAGEPYSIVIPPPNVTGSLHIGHALNNTLQDILIRFNRMRGKRVLWQPGTDHAGIATQMVVERQLAKEGNKGRRELGREKFLERVWAWKAESGGIILNQLRRLGASCDWSRERFTMDEGLSAAVRKVFVDLYEQGLIYRDKRLVNWDPMFQTAISDLEVESRETKGHFWHFAYPLADGSTYRYVEKDADGTIVVDEERNYIVVATTRPETMLGDTAVAVNPEDERYKALIGKMVRLPIAEREIPIVGDEHADPTQGSGAVKITPAHDFNDFAVGKRHGLAQINVMTADARMNDAVPENYRGLDRFKAREQVVAEMEALGFLKKIEDRTIMVPYGDRSNVVIEPYLTDQWYVDAKTLAQPAIAAVREGRTKFTPESWAKTYFNWMENIEPWCVSRQLWWGHRIPVWYGPRLDDLGRRYEPHPLIFCFGDAEEMRREVRWQYEQSCDPVADVVFERAEFQRITKAHEKAVGLSPIESGDEFGMTFRTYPKRDGSNGFDTFVLVEQEEDVLDTWFSSALWPFSTLGWPEKTSELRSFYPTSVLVTAFDIIFFWVARMMMQGIHFMDGEIPFKDVYIHALVRDEKGQKMSKSKGNIIDPLELIDEYGADALRFTLAALAAQGRDIRMSKQRVEGYRNFGTKIWNAARFAEMNGAKPVAGWDPKSAKETLNRWIVGEAAATAKAVTDAIEAYKFNEAAAAVYAFAWNTYCDWYVELAKPLLSGPDGPAKDETRATAAWALDQLLKLVHPFSPFVTEELWKQTEGETPRDGLLISTAWPDLPEALIDGAAREEIGWLIRVISEIRSVRADMNIPPAAKAPLVVSGASKATAERLSRHEAAIVRLARLESVATAKTAPKGSAQMVVDEATYALPLGDLIDIAAERARLAKEVAKLTGEVERLDKKLSNEKFVANADPEVVEAEREKLTAYKAQKKKLDAALKRLSESD